MDLPILNCKSDPRKDAQIKEVDRSRPYTLIFFPPIHFLGCDWIDQSGGSSSSYTMEAVPYLADFEPTSPEEDGEHGAGHDYDQTSYPSASISTSSGETDTGQPSQYQQTDIPLQLSDILPIDRRSYDKMEPPKKEGNDITSTTIIPRPVVLSSLYSRFCSWAPQKQHTRK